jgi:hypothetical protein
MWVGPLVVKTMKNLRKGSQARSQNLLSIRCFFNLLSHFKDMDMAFAKCIVNL